MSELDKLDPPQSSDGDALHAVGRVVAGLVPAGAELFSMVIQPPIERRRDEWMREVSERIRRLEEKHGVDVDSLRDNDAFVDAVLHASTIAMRNSHSEKRQALLNAIMNTALPQSPDESERHMFMNLVDEFTVWHLRLLSLFKSPIDWLERHKKKYPDAMGSLSNIVEAAYPELIGRRDFYDQIWREVNTRGLTKTESLHGMMTAQGIAANRVSTRGEVFLRFISEPVRRDRAKG